MPVAFTNRTLDSNGWTSSPVSFTLSATPTSGNRLIVSAVAGGRNVTDVYDNVGGAGTWTSLYTYTDVYSNSQQIWLSPVLTGTMPTSISVVFDGTGNTGVNVAYAEASGVHATTPEGDNALSTTVFDALEEGTVTTSNANEGLFASITIQGGRDYTVALPSGASRPDSGSVDHSMLTADDLGAADTYTVRITWTTAISATMGMVTLVPGASTQTQEVTATGGMSFAGTTTQEVRADKVATGGMTLAGAATLAVTAIKEAAGGLALAGSAVVSYLQAAFDFTASGGLSYGGTASVSFIDITAPVTTPLFSRIALRMGIGF